MKITRGRGLEKSVQSKSPDATTLDETSLSKVSEGLFSRPKTLRSAQASASFGGALRHFRRPPKVSAVSLQMPGTEPAVLVAGFMRPLIVFVPCVPWGDFFLHEWGLNLRDRYGLRFGEPKS